MNERFALERIYHNNPYHDLCEVIDRTAKVTDRVMCVAEHKYAKRIVDALNKGEPNVNPTI